MHNKRLEWSEETKHYCAKLHSSLSINNEDWHISRSNIKKRTAENLSAALVQLIEEGNINDVIEQIEQSLKWLKSEIKDPGCSRH